jgi:hypothetical protein
MNETITKLSGPDFIGGVAFSTVPDGVPVDWSCAWRAGASDAAGRRTLCDQQYLHTLRCPVGRRTARAGYGLLLMAYHAYFNLRTGEIGAHGAEPELLLARGAAGVLSMFGKSLSRSGNNCLHY